MPPPRLARDQRVAVIGGGPAGLMAAEVLADAGAAVTVFERMPSPGRKLLLAGRGGLNLTHTEEPDRFLDRYGPARPRLAPAIEAFGPEELRAWSAGLGQETFVGSSGRVFPASFRATPLLRAWLHRLDRQGVELRTRHTWTGWAVDDPATLMFTGPDGTAVAFRADATVIALGGASWPRTGSDGSWVDTFIAAGVGVTPLAPANCGFVVTWSEGFADRFAGSPLKNISVTTDAPVRPRPSCEERAGRAAPQTPVRPRLSGEERAGKAAPPRRAAKVRGEAMITRTGIEGGAIYALADALRHALTDTGEAVLRIDLLPDLSADEIARRWDRRRAKDSVSSALRRIGLAPAAVALLREARGNDVPVDAAALAALVKAVPVRLVAPQPIARAISTAGGIRLDEVDEHFMCRHRPGTFVAGEMLDWTAPTGGYLLQATFATAVAAANGAANWLVDHVSTAPRA